MTTPPSRFRPHTSRHREAGRRLLRTFFFIALATLATPLAARADIEIEWTGHLTSAFGDLGTELTGTESVTGTLVLDETVVGVFTPSPNPIFVRSEMLYSGAVISMTMQIDAHAASGTGGDVVLKDAADPLAGDDKYEATALLSGSIGAVPLGDINWAAAYPNTGFSLGASDPLGDPPAYDPGSTSTLWMTTPGGGSAFGRIDGYTVTGGAPQVPVTTPFGLALLTSALGTFAVRRLRGRSAKT